MKLSENVYKRCRPLLGTFVEVTLVDLDSQFSEKDVQNGFEAAFQSIENTSEVMSFHNSESELSRLNSTPIGQWIPISSPLVEVLTLALELQDRTSHQFNVAIATPLMHWNLLPGAMESPNWEHLCQPGFEVRGLQARRIIPIQIDLGGIAKGFAVDCAIHTIQEHMSRISGCVNAGGDLRVFGDQEQQVWIRTGERDRPKLDFTTLKNESIATSIVLPRIHSDNNGNHLVSAYIDTQGRGPLQFERTAVVRAKKCIIADAFTKIALLSHFDKNLEKLAFEYQAEIHLVS